MYHAGNSELRRVETGGGYGGVVLVLSDGEAVTGAML